jgi:bacillithiol system protein YtxJ
MEWTLLTSESQWRDLLKEKGPVIIFKHSTRCSISSMVKNRLERSWQHSSPVYLLDLIALRSISNLIAEDLRVQHESPQLLVVKDGKCIYNASHTMISAEETASYL